MILSFKYSDYYANCCLFPTIICLFNIFIILFVFSELITGVIYKRLKVKRIIFLFYVLLMVGYLFSVNIGRLYHGGWYLFSEKENDAYVESGVIEEITENNRFTFAELSSHYKQYSHTPLNGVCIVIDGKFFYSVSSGEFHIGDTVRFKYLPKSKYILEISSHCQLEDTSP